MKTSHKITYMFQMQNGEFGKEKGRRLVSPDIVGKPCLTVL